MIDVDKIRADFPILNKEIYGKPLVYLDNAATTQKPKQVLDAIYDFYASDYSNIHRGVHYLSEEASAVFEDARETVRKFLNAKDTTEIIFTQGTTDSINLVATSFGDAFIESGDEIILTEMEHHSNIVPWQVLCERRRSKLKVIPIDDDGTLILEKLKTFFTDKTKLLALTYVSNVTGIINPVKDIIELAHKRNVPVLIDGAQAVQHLSVDVQELDCDFFAFSGHKMYAGTGIGILYGKQKWLDKIPPYRFGGGMISRVSFEKTSFQKSPLKFEAGTCNITGAIGLKAAIEYINSVGLDQIGTHEKDVYDYALQTFRDIPNITVSGNAEKMCGAISFNMDNIHHYDAGSILDKLGIAVRTGKHCAEPLMERLKISGTLRASFAVYNTRQEVDALREGLEKVQKMLGNT